MSNKSLAILGIVAAVMVALAVVISGISDGSGKRPAGPAYLIQGLDPAHVGKIVVGAGENAVTLLRRGKAFLVTNKENYPASMKEVNDLISRCVDIKTTGAVQTANPANHADLEVTKEKARSIVEFYTPEPNSALITGIAVGKNPEAGQGAYVRMLPEDNVYLTTESPWIKDQPNDYIDQDLLRLKLEDINSVTVNPGDAQYVLKPGPGESAILLNTPPGKKLKTADAKSVLKALTDLRFDDVTKNAGGLAFNNTYSCKLNDSRLYTLNIAKKGEKTYAVCSVQFTEKRPNEVAKTDTEEELKRKETLLLAYDEAAVFAARHKDWIYEIPEYKAKNLTKKLADLLEDEPKPAEPNTPAPTVAKPEPPTPVVAKPA
ncbi:MAG: DUF4340 domain-containing protein [Sedimentisphaerales bacterium]|nr:DUF4340 domain-containing protein [Sedimentisphaerales bacterium]